MTSKQMLDTVRELGVATREAIAAATGPLHQQIESLTRKNESLTRRVATLESQLAIEQSKSRDEPNDALERSATEKKRPSMRDGGIWRPSETYEKGDVVTHANTSWVCCAQFDAGSRPGTSNAWRMMARGRE